MGGYMATSKVTFTLDEETVRHIEDAAARLTKPKDEVVRDAVNQFHERMGFGGGKISEAERLRRIEVLREIAKTFATRPQSAVDEELRQLREDRRTLFDRPSD
jgi:flagellar motor switch protein FliG